MRPLLLTLALLCVPAAAWADVTGKWLTESGNGQVEIAPCGDKLCGRLVWLKEPLNADGQPKTDINNPNAEQRKRPLLGLHLLSDFTRSSDGESWEGGEIYNPEDGKTYSCTMRLRDPNILQVRGYVGLPILGKTQIWTRVQ